MGFYSLTELEVVIPSLLARRQVGRPFLGILSMRLTVHRYGDHPHTPIFLEDNCQSAASSGHTEYPAT
jgi:hypothetical protein